MTNNKSKIVLFDIYTTGHHSYYALALSKYLYQKDYEVIFVTFKDERTDAYFKDIPYLKIEYIGGNPHNEISKNFFIRNLQVTKILTKCFNIANAHRAKIFHILYLDHNIIPLFFARKIFKPKFNILGTLFWPYFISNKKTDLFHRIYYKITALLLKEMILKKKLNSLFVHTNNIKELIVQELNLKDTEPGNVMVIPDPSLIFYNYCSQEEARERLRLPKNEIILLYFGVLTREKGLDILLEAIKEIKGKFKLLIAGRPVYFTKSYIEAYKTQLDEPTKIIDHIEYISQDDVPFYFLSADAVILPYRKSFLGTSGVLQQACGAGKPVIATNVGEIGETVRKYNLGIVVSPESPDSLREGIQEFLKNYQEMIKKIKQNAIKYAEEHSWEKMAEITETTYRNILKNEVT